jgi:hypothetical protein
MCKRNVLLFFSAVALFLTMGSFAAAQETPSFGEVPWGTAATKVRHALGAKGFTFEKVDSDGDLDFSGQINGQKVFIYEFLNPQRELVKSLVVFATADDEAIGFYHDLIDTLSGKYGSPQKHFEFYMDPYTDEDSESEHETAFAVGKADFGSFWDFDDGGHMWVEISKKLTVNVNYESTAWPAELSRRKNSANSVL